MIVFSLAVGLFGGFSAFAEEAAPSPLESALPSAKEILQIKAQEFSRASVQLKLQEAALRVANPVDDEKLKVVLAQEKAINEELLHLLLAPLEWELKQASDSGYAPGHRTIVALKGRIEEIKGWFSAVE